MSDDAVKNKNTEPPPKLVATPTPLPQRIPSGQGGNLGLFERLVQWFADGQKAENVRIEVRGLLSTLAYGGFGEREKATKKLGTMRDRTVTDQLGSALEKWSKPDLDLTNAREAAVDALGEIGNEEAVRWLLVEVKDKALRVRRQAARALVKIDPNWEENPEIRSALQERTQQEMVDDCNHDWHQVSVPGLPDGHLCRLCGAHGRHIWGTSSETTYCHHVCIKCGADGGMA